MRRFAAMLSLLLVTGCSRTPGAASAPPADLARWEQTAARVTIARDDWGIPHVRGATDADAVFGAIYAQAEDDFNRIEMNYLDAMGRRAEAEGEKAIWRDLRMKLFVDPTDLKQQFGASPVWMQTLAGAWADGLNYFLYTHPDVKPKVLTHFEPWMVLSFTEGSIGGDIESVSLKELEKFYGAQGGAPVALADDEDVAPRFGPEREPTGSNGMAIAPKNTKNGKALFLINPHTSFFFREELQMTSDEGLNAYGASTWGQFFIYQGFNARAGWMHTSSGADVIDEFAETVTPKDSGYIYRFNGTGRPVTAKRVTVRYRTGSGMAERTFTTYRTHHGPVVRQADGKWVSVALMVEPVKALTQSWSRTKAKNLAEFRATLELHTNSSNNTVYADADGNIAYFHANYVPRRDPRFDWTKPVDGSDSATTYRGVHGLDESPNAINPSTGFIQNTNNWPYSVAGSASPRRRDFPGYMEEGVENPRGVHALRVLDGKKDFTLETLRDAAFDSYLPAFADLVPLLVKAYDGLPGADPLKAKLAEPVNQLRGWDFRWSATSVPTAVAVFWGEELWRLSREDEESEGQSMYDFMRTGTTPATKLAALVTAVDTLTSHFGKWNTPWGDINRFQRRTGDIVQPFADSAASIPVPFTSSRWGSLASFGARTWPGTKKWYGTSGNSFVAVVEFGDSVRAKAVTAGGLHSVPGTKHFNDQAPRYAAGDLRDVYFYPSQLKGHTEREYHPGK